ncbi:hypothetical protein KQH29_00090 [bacterium]|nr:hypothetical protein [bacterium]
MPYHSATAICPGKQNFLAALVDFLTTTVGWTLHDDLSGDATPSYVFKSYGESGAEDIYLRFIDDSATSRIFVQAWQYWNAETHSGVNGAYYSSTSYVKIRDAAEFIYWFYADLDHVFIVTKIISTYSGHYSGLLHRFWSDAVALTQAAATAGSNVVIPVNDATLLLVSERYLIKDNVAIERIKITARDTESTPNTVTIEALANPYASGAKIGEDPQPVVTGHFESPGAYYAVNRFDGYQNYNGQYGRATSVSGSLQTDCDPDKRYGRTVLFPWFASHQDASYQEMRGEFIEVYAIGGGNVDSEDILEIGPDTYRAFNLSGPGWCAVKE